MNASPMPCREPLAEPLAPVLTPYPLPVETAEGVWLHTVDGRRVLDLYGGHAVAALGYGHPAWTRALQAQAQVLNFQSNILPLAVRTRAATRLLEFAGGHFTKVFFVNSGAEANENALKMAFATTERSEVVALEHGFHGRTAAAGAITWRATGTWYGFPRLPFDVKFLPRRDAGALAAITERTAAAILGVIDAIVTDRLLENVRRVGALLRERCLVGPVRACQGAGLLVGLICMRPARQIQRLLLARNILAGSAADPAVLRLLPPFTLQASHVELLREALLGIGA